MPLPSDETTPPVTKIYLVTLYETSHVMPLRHLIVVTFLSLTLIKTGRKKKKVSPNKWGHFLNSYAMEKPASKAQA
ncbi:hypothetical protein KCTCHS21_04740 [Cohnella abietis]|uniref:Uncharacterized protein n=1 Tax=Cohnella abietis TaxID=2507935 RepID=A0A3T1CZ92_9BACL|nr:hypothetical protein KCTCHS21_04740 [Cohnella abietis]